MSIERIYKTTADIVEDDVVEDDAGAGIVDMSSELLDQDMRGFPGVVLGKKGRGYNPLKSGSGRLGDEAFRVYYIETLNGSKYVIIGKTWEEAFNSIPGYERIILFREEFIDSSCEVSEGYVVWLLRELMRRNGCLEEDYVQVLEWCGFGEEVKKVDSARMENILSVMNKRESDILGDTHIADDIAYFEAKLDEVPLENKVARKRIHGIIERMRDIALAVSELNDKEDDCGVEVVEIDNIDLVRHMSEMNTRLRLRGEFNAIVHKLKPGWDVISVERFWSWMEEKCVEDLGDGEVELEEIEKWWKGKFLDVVLAEHLDVYTREALEGSGDVCTGCSVEEPGVGMDESGMVREVIIERMVKEGYYKTTEECGSCLDWMIGHFKKYEGEYGLFLLKNDFLMTPGQFRTMYDLYELSRGRDVRFELVGYNRINFYVQNILEEDEVVAVWDFVVWLLENARDGMMTMMECGSYCQMKPGYVLREKLNQYQKDRKEGKEKIRSGLDDIVKDAQEHQECYDDKAIFDIMEQMEQSEEYRGIEDKRGCLEWMLRVFHKRPFWLNYVYRMSPEVFRNRVVLYQMSHGLDFEMTEELSNLIALIHRGTKNTDMEVPPLDKFLVWIWNNTEYNTLEEMYEYYDSGDISNMTTHLRLFWHDYEPGMDTSIIKRNAEQVDKIFKILGKHRPEWDFLKKRDFLVWATNKYRGVTPEELANGMGYYDSNIQTLMGMYEDDLKRIEDGFAVPEEYRTYSTLTQEKLIEPHVLKYVQSIMYDKDKDNEYTVEHLTKITVELVKILSKENIYKLKTRDSIGALFEKDSLTLKPELYNMTGDEILAFVAMNPLTQGKRIKPVVKDADTYNHEEEWLPPELAEEPIGWEEKIDEIYETKDEIDTEYTPNTKSFKQIV